MLLWRTMFIARLFSESIYEDDSRAFKALTKEQQKATKRHNFIAHQVCEILDLPLEEFEKLTKTDKEDFYHNFSEMLLDYPRLSLFVPFYNCASFRYLLTASCHVGSGLKPAVINFDLSSLLFSGRAALDNPYSTVVTGITVVDSPYCL